jgi:radical SAM superfamily enzyme YgiQ (UPF0313 family)
MRDHGYPFTFLTEASVNLAEDKELLDMMVEAGFYGVFLGIETPDQDSLRVTKKQQNTLNPLAQACHKINEAGLMIYAGFIIGFDGERSGAGQRIVDFVEETFIPQPMLGILQALPNTALWNRLEKEHRLIEHADALAGDQNALMNFVPTRPLEEIGQEYVEALWNLYEPSAYLNRCLRHCLQIAPNRRLRQQIRFSPHKAALLILRLFHRQGYQMGEIRAQFWRQFRQILTSRPQLLGLYLGLCAAGEHFWEYRLLARERISLQLDKLTQGASQSQPANPRQASSLSRSTSATILMR